MSNETVSIAIANWDSDEPILLSVVETDEVWINWIVILNPDWTLFWT